MILIFRRAKNKKKRQQAGAELGQAQVKLDVTVEVGGEVETTHSN